MEIKVKTEEFDSIVEALNEMGITPDVVLVQDGAVIHVDDDVDIEFLEGYKTED